MRAALVIVAKDLRQHLRDRSALLIAIVVPLALASIFGLTLRDVTSGDVTFEYAVVDLDRGQVAQGFRGHRYGIGHYEGSLRKWMPPCLEGVRGIREVCFWIGFQEISQLLPGFKQRLGGLGGERKQLIFS